VLLFAFYYLFHVADEHLSPSLQKISVTFKLSESLAGVTLLAFGAGAPDVFASLSASKDATASGVQMGLSVLLGSSLFILAIATSATLFASPEPIKVKKMALFKRLLLPNRRRNLTWVRDCFTWQIGHADVCHNDLFVLGVRSFRDCSGSLLQ